MNKITLVLTFLATVLVARAADPKPPEPFALYPVCLKDVEGATAFSYQGALTAIKDSGFYHEPAVLTMAHVGKIDWGYPEAGTIPFPALIFYFSPEGFKVLRDYLRSPQASDLVLFIDGHAYMRLEVVPFRRFMEHPSSLEVLIRSALDDSAELKRLFNVLQAASRAKKR